MADETTTFGIEYTTNADKVAKLIRGLGDALDDAGMSGEISGKQWDKASGGILSIEKAVNSSSPSVRKYSKDFETLRKSVSDATKALQGAAQDFVVGGGTDVLGAAARTMDVDTAKEIIAINKAEGLTAQQVAQEVVAAEAKKTKARLEAVAKLQAANSSSAKGYQRGFTDPKSFMGQADSRDASSGLKASDTTWAKQAAASAEFRSELNKTEISFQKQQREAELTSLRIAILGRHSSDASSKVQDLGNSVTKTSGSLPTLRYALYDVSNTMAITGAGMLGFSVLSLKASVDYQRAFADVIRTNEQLMGSSVASERAFHSFISMASELPTSFAGLTEIGTLAGQLGVSAGSMEDFTRATAMFSTVTGESIDTTATAFGRLDALLPDVQGNYEALGSSILNVGINSVATEGEVIKITTQLAGVGGQAGLTSDEVIGLSGALASVGVQPELARGTITRLFGQISRAVATGGDNLEGFAAIAGTSASAFATSWGSSPMQATLDVFRGIRDRGADAESALRAVGITSVRDVPAILRLAQTMDSVLVPALADAEQGMREGSQLSENYGVVAETTASKLQILSNNFQSLLALMGDSSSVLSKVVDAANGLLEWAIEMQKNPVTAFMSQFAVVSVGVLGSLTLIAAAVTRASAGMIAFKTAMQEAGLTSTGFRANLLALTGTIAGVDAQATAAAGSTGRLTSLMGKLGVASLALSAIPLAQWFQGWVSEVNGAVVDVNTLAQSLGTLDVGMSDASIKDFEATLTKAVESLGSSTQTAANSAFIPIVGAYAESVRNASYAAETEFGLGLERLGTKATSWWTTNVFTGEPSWMAGFFDASYEELDKFEESFIQAWEAASSETEKQAVLDAFRELEEQVVAAGYSAEDMKYNFSDFFDVVGSGVDTSLLAAEANDINRESLEALSQEMSTLVDDVFAAVNAQYDLHDALFNVGEALVQEGVAVAFTGDAMQGAIKEVINQSSGAGNAAANLQVMFDYLVSGGYASAAQLTHLSQVIAGLKTQSGGKVSAPSLAMPDFAAFSSGMESARASASRASGATRDFADSADEASKKIRTLKDYASDLKQVWDRAFEIRFSGQQTIDAVRDSIQKLRDAAEASAKKVQDLRNSIRSLSADSQALKSDISILEYYLRIANEYGDQKRATAIEAELAKKRAELASKTSELADKNKELKKEQDSQNKTLVGNSQAARDNRKAVGDLVQQYQAHIGALASSGMSQQQLAVAAERLRADFIRQATQLGYNRNELKKFEAAFGDVSAAIKAVPPINISIKGLTPAQIALKEMEKSVSSLRKNIGGGINVPITTSSDNSGAIRALQSQRDAYKAQLSALYNTLGGNSNTNTARLENAIRDLNRELARRGYASGGFTGRGGKYEPKGIVHGGEYVFRKDQVDQSTGMPTQAALMSMMPQGSLPSRTVAPSTAGTGGGAAMVSLTPATIQAIAQALPTGVILDGNIVGEVSSREYARSNAQGSY